MGSDILGRWLGRPTQPLDEAQYWFITNSPIEIIGQNAHDVPGWIHGVMPVRTEDLPQPDMSSLGKDDGRVA